MKKALIVYWSATGNTEKVAFAIRDGLIEAGVNVNIVKTRGNEILEFNEYDLISVGFPIYSCFLPEIMDKFLKGIYQKYYREKRIILGAPKIPGKHALIFCTYAGAHSGFDEAIPAVKYAGQLFIHFGIPVIDEWYVVGEVHENPEASFKGKLGDIRGRPTDEELTKIRLDAFNLEKRLTKD